MNFRRLDVWKRSTALSVEIYRYFAASRDFGFRDQITRSSLSIPSNIAEGTERKSDKDTRHFYNIAKSSCAELYTQIIVGVKIGYIARERGRDWLKELSELSAMLGGLVRHLEKTNSLTES
jgi:four helix bundle protein